MKVHSGKVVCTLGRKKIKEHLQKFNLVYFCLPIYRVGKGKRNALKCSVGQEKKKGKIWKPTWKSS
jgi:hypothetical protein